MKGFIYSSAIVVAVLIGALYITNGIGYLNEIAYRETPETPRAINHGFAIRQMYLNRVAQFHREELNVREFRDSLALDVDAYFINNPNIR